MKRILFVCTGNTCRSPLAEHLFRQKLRQANIEGDFVRSAGIAAIDGFPASDPVRQLLLQKGIQEQHVSQSVREELIEWADLILTMTGHHADSLRAQYTQKATHIYPLKAYVAAYQTSEENAFENKDPIHYSLDIADPIGGSLTEYETVMDELDQLLDSLLKQLDDE